MDFVSESDHPPLCLTRNTREVQRTLSDRICRHPQRGVSLCNAQVFAKRIGGKYGEWDRQVRSTVSMGVISHEILVNRELLDNLARAGFQTSLGPDGAGLLPLTFERGGGFYIGQ